MDQEPSDETIGAPYGLWESARTPPREQLWMNEPTDETLAEMLERGDERVMSLLMDYVCPYVERLLLRQMRRLNGYSEDVIQIALRNAWRNRNQYRREEGTVRQWFRTIAINCGKSMIRGKMMQARNASVSLELDDGQYIDPVDRTESVDDQLEPEPLTAEQAATLEILAGWPQADQMIILRYFANPDGERGNWAAELAEELGMNASTIRSKGRRLEKKLRKELCKRGFECADPPPSSKKKSANAQGEPDDNDDSDDFDNDE